MNDPTIQEAAHFSGSSARVRVLVEIAVLLVLCWLFFFFGLTSFGLLGADEPRYAQVAREMLERHDWVTPVLYGKPWLEKPAGYYWAAMASYRIFGVNDWAARFPGSAAATVMAVFLYFWLRRFRSGTQLNAATVVISTAFMTGFSRGASMDIQLAVPFTVGMLAWWSWYETKRRRWLALFYVCMALGTLAKGPVAPFLAVLVIALFAVVRRELRVLLHSLWLPGIVLYLFVAMPWYVAVQLAVPQFFREFILEHNLDRFATDRYFHRQPFWYYLPVLFAGLVPWSVPALSAAIRAGRGLRRQSGVQDADPLPLFLLVWAAGPLVFFSFSHSKLPGYILPCVPPLGIMAALYLQEKSKSSARGSTILIILHALIPAALLAAVMLAPTLLLHRHPSAQAIRLAVTAGVLAFAVVATLILRGGYNAIRTATLLPTVLALILVIRLAAPLIDATQSMRPAVQQIRQSHADSIPVIAFDTPRQVDYGLAYYLDRPLGGAELQEFSAEHVNAFPQCGRHTIVAKPGSVDAIRVLAGSQASLQRVTSADFASPWQVYSLAQPCHDPVSR